MKKEYLFTNNRIIYFVGLFVIFVSTVLLTSYAFFNYTRTGDVNTLTTSQIYFTFSDGIDYINIGNAYPISESDIDQNYEDNFSITAHNALPDGVRYTISIVPGDTETGKTRLLDEVMSIKLDVFEDGDGFTTGINNYSTFKSPVFVDGKALLATGIVKDTNSLTTKNFKLSMFIDSSKIHVSSTTKREVNAEGNPSLADATSGNVTEGRYIKNDNNLVNTVLYPARSIQEGKIIYTTNEFKNSYYSVKLVIEAHEVNHNEELVYFDTNGGSLGTDIMSVTLGENYPQLPTPTREGYTFLGWNGKNLINTNNETGITSQTLLVDRISLLSGTYTVSAKLQNNSPINVSIRLLDIETSNIFTAPYVLGNQTNITHITFTTNENMMARLYVIGQNAGYNVDVSDVQLEEGTEATAYEPYYVTSSVTVTQTKDHVLKAIWQKNN